MAPVPRLDCLWVQVRDETALEAQRVVDRMPDFTDSVLGVVQEGLVLVEEMILDLTAFGGLRFEEVSKAGRVAGLARAGPVTISR